MKQSYLLLAEVLEYPTPGLCATAERLGTALHGSCAEAAEAVLRFAEYVAGQEPDALEELYIRTFDISALCCLDCGYQLFGETYKRGVFLVKMREALRTHGVPEGSELPDHLPSVLRLLSRLADSDDPRGLCDEVIVPAVHKMLAGFSNDRENPYAALLGATARLLEHHFGIVPEPSSRAVRLPVVTDFMSSREL